MKTSRLGLLAAVISLLASPVLAQTVMGRVSTDAPTYVNGDSRPFSLTTDGALRVVGGASGTASDQVQGAAPDGTALASSGNGFKMLGLVRGVFGAQTLETVAPMVLDQRGQVRAVMVGGTTVAPVDTATTVNLPFTNNATTAAPLGTLGYVWSGSAAFIARGDASGQFMVPSPTTTAANALAATVTSAVGTSLIVKASAGNLYDWRVTSGASAGYVLVFNSTTVPADGAVTPVDCHVIAANSTASSGPMTIPARHTTGIVIVFSTTGCFTKTASSTAFIRARAL